MRVVAISFVPVPLSGATHPPKYPAEGKWGCRGRKACPGLQLPWSAPRPPDLAIFPQASSPGQGFFLRPRLRSGERGQESPVMGLLCPADTTRLLCPAPRALAVSGPGLSCSLPPCLSPRALALISGPTWLSVSSSQKGLLRWEAKGHLLPSLLFLKVK